MQKTQNGGTDPVPAGEVTSGYHRFGSAVETSDKEKSFFEGINTTIAGIASLAPGEDNAFVRDGLQKISSAVNEAVAKFDVQHPDRTAPALANGLRATRELIEKTQQSKLSATARYNIAHELSLKKEQFNDALCQALGISLLAIVAPEKDITGRFAAFAGLPEGFSMAIRGQQFWVKAMVTAQSPIPLSVEKLWVRDTDGTGWDVQPTGTAPKTLQPNQQANQRFRIVVSKEAKYTRPFFTRPDQERAWYDIQDEQNLNRTAAPYPLSAELDVVFEGEHVHVSQAVQNVRHVTGRGAVLNPLMVAPALSLSVSPKAGIVPVSGPTVDVSVSVLNNVKGEAKGLVKLELPNGWSAEPSQIPFAFSKDGQEQRLSFKITPGKLEQKPYQVTALAEYNGERFTEGYTMTGYEGVRRYPMYTPATYRTTGVDVKVAPGLRVGYIMGTGDDVPKALDTLGVPVQLLSPQDVASGDLTKYDAIVLGVRVYAARPDIITYNGRLLDYVKNGGVVVVQYNTAQFDNNYGPYPYTLTNDPEKVVDETAKVTILNPQHPLMNWPNKIAASDFDGWVEERGHSFMKQWDARYEALTETHDPEQDPQKGGLLYARYGKGAYVYGAYALYRQTPEGVPGAFRLLANLVSLSKNPGLGK
jgi:hypothetical protein